MAVRVYANRLINLEKHKEDRDDNKEAPARVLDREKSLKPSFLEQVVREAFFVCLSPTAKNSQKPVSKKMILKQLKYSLYLPRLNMIYILVHNIHNMC